MTAPVIRVDGVSKRYTKFDDTPMLVTRIARLRSRTTRSELLALRDTSFEVARGEVLGVIGRNGSGKSTLLRMLAGVTAPTTGSVVVRGRVAPLIAVGVGFHPELTGRENVYVNGTVLGLSRRDITRRLDEIIDFAEIAGFIDTPVKFYSSGMYVRLGFAVSVLSEPDVLIVDEVLSVGDIAFQLKSFDRMAEIQRSGATIVVVSHNLNAIRNLCRRTLVLHNGEQRFDGETTEAISLYHDYLGEEREIEEGQAALPHDHSFDGRAVIERFDLLDPSGVRTRHVNSLEDVTFDVDVRFTKEVEGPILGFSMFNSAGVQVYGESSGWRQQTCYRPGDRMTATIRIRPTLATGTYSCLVGLVSPTGTPIAPQVKPLLVYVGGRSGVNGIADLGARIDIRHGSSNPQFPVDPGGDPSVESALAPPSAPGPVGP